AFFAFSTLIGAPYGFGICATAAIPHNMSIAATAATTHRFAILVSSSSCFSPWVVAIICQPLRSPGLFLSSAPACSGFPRVGFNVRICPFLRLPDAMPSALNYRLASKYHSPLTSSLLPPSKDVHVEKCFRRSRAPLCLCSPLSFSIELARSHRHRH